MIVFLNLGIENGSEGRQGSAEALVAMSSMLSLNTYVAEVSLGWGEYEVNEEA